ncbi:hypothetical protein LSH36_771g00037 [Paralvinella palmiformis]|uniref:Protein-tyrosine-phosphatase n=1 Tax=Paralvinella palmiformis TaxID=53620 RepID=A0AAD9J0W6_9ANNE|nr:hypothetical protein LSH36_771g00037 [Paralvinella palmiformis]
MGTKVAVKHQSSSSSSSSSIHKSQQLHKDGYCLYGDEPDCAFTCHCASVSDCRDGICLDGCDKGPLGYNWGGPSCQIGCAEWLSQFNLGVFNTSDKEIRCGYHHGNISTYSTITCVRPVVGRYVHFKRVGGPDIYAAVLCEVVIIGHRYIDCTQCPTGISCNDVTGCKACHGSYQPDCKQELPNHHKELINLINVTSSSITIDWQHISGISHKLSDSYGYLIQYKDHLFAVNYTDAGTANYSTDPYWKFENLAINTIYLVKITPFRKCDSLKDFGRPYNVLKVNTQCAKPDNVSSLDATLIPSNGGLPKISVMWQTISSVDSHCDNITLIYLIYKLASSTNRTTVQLLPNVSMFVIIPEEEGQYKINIVLENNRGYSSTSDVKMIHVKGSVTSAPTITDKTTRQTPTPLSILIIAAGSSAGVIVIIAVLIIVGIVWRRRHNITIYYMIFKKSLTHSLTHSVTLKAKTRLAATERSNGDVSSNNVKTDDVKACGSKRLSRSNDIIRLKTEDHGERNRTNDAIGSVERPRTDFDLYTTTVSVDRFKSYVSRKMAETEEWSEEFETLPQPNISRCSVGLTADNKQRNRYSNILPSPKISTSVDFWRMVWQEKCTRIVVVIDIKETGRKNVDPYWPKEIGDSLIFGRISVTAEAENSTADYAVRIMTIKKQKESRTVHQFHFLSWKDHDKPLYGAYTLLDFVNKIHSHDKFAQGPVIVHCSAGVGRTGTFIALDILYQMAVTDSVIDVYGCVRKLRHERMFMVQNEILEGLKKIDYDPEKEGLKLENINKNRNLVVVPGESFKAHNTFVVTQMPLPDTIADFWQLIVEQGCQAIVMLNDMTANDETCLRYWPEELNSKVQYGEVFVELLSSGIEDCLIIRDFKVTDNGSSFSESDVLMIRQFQLLSWPQVADVPEKRDHLLDLLEKLQNWQHHCGIPTDKWKPLIHCIDGSSRSGMFCGMSFVLERLLIEQDVNAFLAARYVSRHRPHFFTKMHEYQFLYQMAMEYLLRCNECCNL